MIELMLAIVLHDHDTGIQSTFADCHVWRDDTELHASCLPRSESASGPAEPGAPINRVVIFDGVFVERLNCVRSGYVIHCGVAIFGSGFE